MVEVEKRYSSRRSSTTTVASSVADEIVRESCRNSSPSDVKRPMVQNHIHIKDSKYIFIGDLSNYFGGSPEKAAKTESTPTSIESLLSSHNLWPKRQWNCLPKKIANFHDIWRLIVGRKYWIAPLLVIAVFIGLIIWLTIFVLEANQSDNETATESTANSSSTSSFSLSKSTLKPPKVKIISRDEWEADPPKRDIKRLLTPIRRIIVAQTLGETCFNNCSARVKKIQVENADLKDIPYNFLIGGDGSIYEGRGFKYEGEHTTNEQGSSFNDIGICVAFIGTFKDTSPPAEMKLAFQNFMNYYSSETEISVEHKIFIQDQLGTTQVPADALNDLVKGFDEFYSLGQIYTRADWNANDKCSREIGRLELPVDRIVITDTMTDTCNDDDDCKYEVSLIQLEQTRVCGASDYADIAYGFLVGGESGCIVEGRGFDFEGEADKGVSDSTSLRIALIGDFIRTSPNENVVNSTMRLIADALALGKVSDNFRISTDRASSHQLYETVKDWYSNRFEDFNFRKQRVYRS